MSAEMEIVFTDLLHLGGMKQAMRNTRRSVGRVPVFSEKSKGFRAPTLSHGFLNTTSFYGDFFC